MPFSIYKREKVKTDPSSLGEKLALDEAIANEGKDILKGKVKDKKYSESKWRKKAYYHKALDGRGVEIHYWEDIQTGSREGFKFKN